MYPINQISSKVLMEPMWVIMVYQEYHKKGILTCLAPLILRMVFMYILGSCQYIHSTLVLIMVQCKKSLQDTLHIHLVPLISRPFWQHPHQKCCLTKTFTDNCVTTNVIILTITMAIESFWVLQNHHHCEGLHPFECPARLVIALLLQLLNAHRQPQNN